MATNNQAAPNRYAVSGRKRKKEGMWKQAFVRIMKNPTAVVGIIGLSLLIFLVIIGPYLMPYTYLEMDLSSINKGCSWKHPFGTDGFGRDCLSRLLYGGRYSLGLGFSASFMGFACSVVIGLTAGYFGGKVDNLIMRICDVLQAIPPTLLSIIISVTLGTGFFNTVLALAIGGIPGSIRLLRGQILKVRSEEYLEAAQAINCSSARIMFRHIFPNVLSPMIVSLSMGIGSMIMVAAGLSVIGLGIQPPSPEWGAMLSGGRNYITNYPHLVIFPGLFIFFTLTCFNFFGEGLRDAIDPKLKK
jgi:ABC-type dipeptide/oligopeptide/nickel transport system permease subunit